MAWPPSVSLLLVPVMQTMPIEKQSLSQKLCKRPKKQTIDKVSRHDLHRGGGGLLSTSTRSSLDVFMSYCLNCLMWTKFTLVLSDCEIYFLLLNLVFNLLSIHFHWQFYIFVFEDMIINDIFSISYKAKLSLLVSLATILSIDWVKFASKFSTFAQGCLSLVPKIR